MANGALCGHQPPSAAGIWQRYEDLATIVRPALADSPGVAQRRNRKGRQRAQHAVAQSAKSTNDMLVPAGVVRHGHRVSNTFVR